MRWFDWTIVAAVSCLPALAPAEEPAQRPRDPDPVLTVLRIDAPLAQDSTHQRADATRALDAAPGHGAKREKGPYLGISASPAPAVLRKQLGLQPGMALVVDFVMPDSPAAKAGLKEFDVLVKLDDQLLINQEQLAVLVRSHKIGDDVKLGMIHDGKPVAITAKLAEHELEPLPFEDLDALERDAGERKAENEKWLRVFPQPQVIQIAPGEKPGANGWHEINGRLTTSTMTWMDGDRSYTVTTSQAGHQTFTVKGKDGTVLFEGPIDTPKGREKVPPEFRDKLERLQRLLPGGEVGSSGQKPATQPVHIRARIEKDPEQK